MSNGKLHARLTLLMLALTALTSVGCATDKKVMAQAEQIHGGLEPAVMEDPDLDAYLQKVGERIIAAAKQLDAEGYGPKSHKSDDNSWMFSKDMQFHFVNSKTLNAFTTGGEHMYIYNELFQECKTEDELAAVMAHEYGHVYARHVEKGMDRQVGQHVGTGVAAVGGGVAGFLLGGFGTGLSTANEAASLASTTGQFVGMGYTREDENEADKLGFAFYTRAGWDPNHFADFFQHMIDKGYDKTPEMMSDHPTLANRVKNTERRVKELPAEASGWRKPPIADEQQFQALQQRSAQLALKMPDDKNLQQAQAILASFSSCVSPMDQPMQKQARKKVQDAGWKAQWDQAAAAAHNHQ
jgi:predicted Zn-dependent protease